MSNKVLHPGIILIQQFLGPNEITPYRLAKDTFVSTTRINQIVNQKKRITPDTALRFAKYFGNKANYWLDLQNKYDLFREKSAIQDQLKKIKKFKKKE